MTEAEELRKTLAIYRDVVKSAGESIHAFMAACDEKDKLISNLTSALSELLEVADLRGETELPHPADDPRLWSARMQAAWDDARDVLTGRDEEACS